MKKDKELIGVKIKEFLGDQAWIIEVCANKEEEFDNDSTYRWYRVEYIIKGVRTEKKLTDISYVGINDKKEMVINHKDTTGECVDLEFNAVNFLREFVDVSLTGIVLG